MYTSVLPYEQSVWSALRKIKHRTGRQKYDWSILHVQSDISTAIARFLRYCNHMQELESTPKDVNS